ncbi:MAG: BACON domain-containing carbohydrate-binding protein, partial [bacterium]|nr:BACON domain-containing carbohydrate-binding protein [bacterium]
KVNGPTSGITSTVELKYILADGARDGVLWLNGEILTSTEEDSNFYTWQPQKLGENVFVYNTGDTSVTTRVHVAKLTYATPPVPRAPMPVDDNVQIAVETRTVDVGGGMKALSTAGTGTWTAAASDSWITLGATSGKAGDEALAYTVSANTNVGARTGFVYVSGHVHTITQKGREATVAPEDIEVEVEGGSESVAIDFSGRFAWDACPNADWLSVAPTHGIGAGAVTVTAAPYNEVGTRSGTLTIGDRTVTVFQYGRRMKLSTYSETRDYFTHVLPITVDALAITTWNVTPNNSWISVVDQGATDTHKGGGYVTVAIAENPSYRARTGTVTIGTETFTVTQEGRTDCSFEIDPENTTASVNGANGHIAVCATPDLPWSARSQANWLTVLQSTEDGAGNGNIFYTASPNTTLVERRGTITITPVSGVGLEAKTHTVVQPPAVATLSHSGYEFAAPGESVAVTVTVPGAISWSVEEDLDWLTVLGGTSRLGSGDVTLQAIANNSVNARSGTITLAGHPFTVRQRGRGFTVDCDNFSFDTESDGGSFTVTPDGDMAWQATVSDPSWIRIMGGWDSGYGVGEVMFMVTDYFGDGTARSGYIEVGDKQVRITQRAYELSISPSSLQVKGNAGEGEIGVSATLGDIWNAIATEPWITVITDTGNGNGTVRYTFTENDTGKTRSGKIIIAGEEYTLTQAARVTVNIAGTVVGHGTIDGAGLHDQGETVRLTAIPDDGYAFLYWTDSTGDKMQNPLTVTADVAKGVTATFAPLTPEFLSPAESTTAGVRLAWTNLAWAAEYRIYRAPSSEIPSEPLATLPANGDCTYLDDSAELEKTYWYWVEAVGSDDTTESRQPVSGRKVKPIVFSALAYENLQGATHTNPDRYQEETTLAFTPPSTRAGYTFAGWTPSAITADMTGDIAVRANWTANAYQIVYYANGGAGTMAPVACTYDREARIGTNEFTRAGYLFLGWATAADGAVAYEPDAAVTNLTAVSGGVVALYAVWEQENVSDPVITPADGAIFRTATCTVTISCETPGATIYYTTNGRTPSARPAFQYNGPFEIAATATIVAFAVKGEKQSGYVEATLTYVEPEPLTFQRALVEAKLAGIATGGDADWTPIEDASVPTGDASARSGACAEADDGVARTSWLTAKVNGAGTLTFWWKVSCEPDPRGKYTYDHAAFEADGAIVARTDGVAGWTQVTHTFADEGEHTLRWSYHTDGYLPIEGEYDGCVWVNGVTWSGEGGAVQPSIADDAGATVTGDATSGFVVTPSAGRTDVEVTIPEGIDAEKVSVAVTTEVRSVKPRGAKIIVVKGGCNLTAFLDIPAADANGVVDLTRATVKEAIVKETLDPAKGAVIRLDAAEPSLTTPPTKPGLVYTLREGAQLTNMANGASTVGDGQPWTPKITVKGGKSGFYSIRVTK